MLKLSSGYEINMRAYNTPQLRNAANTSIVVFVKEVPNVVEYLLHKTYFYLAGMMQSTIEESVNSDLMVFSWYRNSNERIAEDAIHHMTASSCQGFLNRGQRGLGYDGFLLIPTIQWTNSRRCDPPLDNLQLTRLHKSVADVIHRLRTAGAWSLWFLILRAQLDSSYSTLVAQGLSTSETTVSTVLF